MESIRDISIDLPLWLIRRRTRMILSKYLDISSRRVLTSGLTSDWRGLADLSGLTNLDIQTLERSDQPTLDLLNIWDKMEGSTVSQLTSYIQQLERIDVLEEISHFIEEDITEYNKKHRPVQDNTVSGLSVGEIGEGERITVHDNAGMEFDAYVCVCDGDLEFVTSHLIPHLESPPNSLRLFIELRDMRGGVWEHNASAHLIAQRCKKVIIILSPQFLSDSKCEWILQYAHSVSTENRSKLLVPVMIQECVIPKVLRGLNTIKLSRYTDDRLEEVAKWQWERLARTLQPYPTTKT